ncbi:hypothetical protein LINPERPRIM_LOCUS10949 [Linum perenne]
MDHNFEEEVELEALNEDNHHDYSALFISAKIFESQDIAFGWANKIALENGFNMIKESKKIFLGTGVVEAKAKNIFKDGDLGNNITNRWRKDVLGASTHATFLKGWEDFQNMWHGMLGNRESKKRKERGSAEIESRGGGSNVLGERDGDDSWNPRTVTMMVR